MFLDGGDDTVRHDVTANKASCVLYWGGSRTDTLQLVLTAAQLSDAAIKADIACFTATGGGGLLGVFVFNSMNLTVVNFEKIIVVAPVDATDDKTRVGEDPTVVINVLANDIDIGAATNAALRVTGYDAGALPGTLTLNANNTFTYVPGAAYQYLAAGETAVAVFTYTIGDDQGFTDTATVQVTVTGANDAPVFQVAPVTGTITQGAAATTGGAITFATSTAAIPTSSPRRRRPPAISAPSSPPRERTQPAARPAASTGPSASIPPRSPSSTTDRRSSRPIRSASTTGRAACRSRKWW